MKIFNTLGAVLLLASTLLFSSCDKANSYQPFSASAQSRSVLLSYVDSSDKDLLSNDGLIGQIKIYGVRSQKEIPFEVKKFKNGSTERHYLAFSASLPDVKDMKFNGRDEAEGVSPINISFGGQDLTLSFSFKYTRTSHENLGGNMIMLDEVSYEEKAIRRQENRLTGSHFLFCIEKDNDGFTLKTDNF